MLIEDGSHDPLQGQVCVVTRHIHCDAEAFHKLTFVIRLEGLSMEVAAHSDQVTSLRGRGKGKGKGKGNFNGKGKGNNKGKGKGNGNSKCVYEGTGNCKGSGKGKSTGTCNCRAKSKEEGKGKFGIKVSCHVSHVSSFGFL